MFLVFFNIGKRGNLRSLSFGSSQVSTCDIYNFLFGTYVTVVICLDSV